MTVNFTSMKAKKCAFCLLFLSEVNPDVTIGNESSLNKWFYETNKKRFSMRVTTSSPGGILHTTIMTEWWLIPETISLALRYAPPLSSVMNICHRLLDKSTAHQVGWCYIHGRAVSEDKRAAGCIPTFHSMDIRRQLSTRYKLPHMYHPM